jgi:hypothetical protein
MPRPERPARPVASEPATHSVHRTARSRNRALRTLLACAVAQAACLLSVATATADYHVAVCSDLSTGAPSNASGWSASQSGSYVGASLCNGGEVMDAAMFAGVSHNYTDNATLTFTAPPNTTIAAFSLWRWDQAAPSQPYGSPVNTIGYDGQNVDWCTQADGCSVEGSTTSSAGSIVGASGLSAHEITVQAACGGGPGGVCPASGESDEIRIYGGDIELAQTAAPTVQSVGGSLIAAGAHTGTQTVSYSASDDGSGIYSASLLIDGQLVQSQIPNSNGGRCHATRRAADGGLVFNYAQPCPAAASGTLSYDTNQLTGGPHTVRVVIADAAGNTTIAFDGSITVANGTPAAEAGAGVGTTARWVVSLRVSPRLVHRHTVTTLTGRVATTPRPPQGKLIYLQARGVASVWRGRGRKRHRVNVYGRWITFHVLHTKADGRFAASYRFRLGGQHRYQMRAIAPAEGGFANAAGSSAPVLVTET